MTRFLSWALRQLFLVLVLVYVGVILPWSNCARLQQELDEAHNTITRLNDQLSDVRTSEYSMELSNEVCILGIWTVELNSSTVHIDRTTFDGYHVGDEYPCTNAFSSFLLTSRQIVTDLNQTQ